MAYGEYRNTTIEGQAGTTWYVKIYKKSFSGSPTEMTLAGEGFEIRWTGQGGTRDRQFLTSECIVKFYIQNASDESFIYDVFDNGDKEYFVRIYKDGVASGNIWWFGWVQPSFDKFSNEPYPYPVDLIATDSIGVYKERKDDVLTQTNLYSSDRINNHINDFANTMSLYDSSASDLAPIPQNATLFKTSIDWWRDGGTYQSNDPFYLYYTSPGAYRENIEKKPFNYKKYDVLQGSLQTFNTVGYLSDGAYHFIQPNSLANSTSGNIDVYSYVGTNNEVVTSSTLTTLLEIDGTTSANKGTILAGSTITYEPIFKSVTLDFINGSASFNVPPGVDLQTEYTAGQLQQADPDVGLLGLIFNVYHRESFSASNVTLNTGYSLENWTIRTTGTLIIKVGTGADTRWLVEGTSATGSASLVWQSSAGSITLQRGFGVNPNGTVCNNIASGFVASSMMQNIIYDPTDSLPSNIQYDPDTTTYTAETNIAFQALPGQVPIPQVSGDITIELDCTNQYWEYNSSPPAFSDTHQSVTPTSITKQTVANDVVMQGIDTEALDGSVGLTYETSQNVNDAYESYDLGQVVVGCTTANSGNFADSIYSVKFNGTSGLEIASSGFRRNNTGSYANISQLLTKEFLELQTEPLEILQADIFSPDVSPLKLVKYSINDNGSYKYYQFLGGTFKAQSETMSGEWYKVSQGLTVTPDEPTEVYDQAFKTTQIDSSIKKNTIVSVSDRDLHSYGVISTAASINVLQNKVTLSSASKGKIYDNQKVLLCYPDGSNPLILTANGDSSTTDTQIDLDNWTPEIEYPIGCVLLPLPYDLSNRIQGENLAPGVTTTALYLSPDRFTTTSKTTFSMYTRDNLGSVQQSSYASRNKVFASTFIPLGYKVAEVLVYCNQNRSVKVYRANTINDTTVSLYTGNANTAIPFSTPWVSVEGEYISIELEFGASSDEIYGAKLTLQQV